jgi:hypothetical protein
VVGIGGQQHSMGKAREGMCCLLVWVVSCLPACLPGCSPGSPGTARQPACPCQFGSIRMSGRVRAHAPDATQASARCQGRPGHWQGWAGQSKGAGLATQAGAGDAQPTQHTSLKKMSFASRLRSLSTTLAAGTMGKTGRLSLSSVWHARVGRWQDGRKVGGEVLGPCVAL